MLLSQFGNGMQSESVNARYSPRAARRALFLAAHKPCLVSLTTRSPSALARISSELSVELVSTTTDLVLGCRVIELLQGLNAARKILVCVVNQNNDREFDFHETPLATRFRTNGLVRPRVVTPGRNGS